MYVTALQAGGHVPMVTSHLLLSEWQHPYFMNTITIHARVIPHYYYYRVIPHYYYYTQSYDKMSVMNMSLVKQ